MQQVRDNFPQAVIFASTGVTLESVDKVFELADGAFVGTYFKKDGIFENPIDEDRVKNFMDHVHEITSKL
jgi:predicted TIM-barrel enzyme